MKAKVAERGQVTIPKKLREKLGLRPGTILDFSDIEGKLVAVKSTALDDVDRVYGSLGRGRRSNDIINDLRNGPA